MEVKCPKCGDEINFLHYSGEQITSWSGTASISENNLEHDCDYDSHDYDADENVTYTCPECGEVLFTDQKEAEVFLKNKLTRR